MKAFLSIQKEITSISILEKLKKSKKNLLVVFVLSMIIIGSTIISSKYFEIPYSHYMRDPVILLGGKLYTGWFSQLGVMLWSITAGFCFLNAKLLAYDPTFPMLKGFLYYSFFLTIFLGADDIFMFHDEIFPLWGIHENIFISSYLMIILVFLIKYYKLILKTDYDLLGLAFFFFAISIFLDKIPYEKKIIFLGSGDHIIFEDGSKLIGILLWMFYFHSVENILLIGKKVNSEPPI